MNDNRLEKKLRFIKHLNELNYKQTSSCLDKILRSSENYYLEENDPIKILPDKKDFKYIFKIYHTVLGLIAVKFVKSVTLHDDNSNHVLSFYNVEAKIKYKIME